MKRALLILLLFFYSTSGVAQKEFFKSAQLYTEGERAELFASISIKDNLLLFNAPDYQLYAYNKNSGTLKWSYKLNRKSTVAPHFYLNSVLANAKNEVVLLDTATGKLQRKLRQLQTIQTAPLVKNNILYATGIFNYGNLFAYDLRADSVIWSRPVAHGISKRPYYQPDKIIANAEGYNWLEVDYNGKFIKPQCKDEGGIFPVGNGCRQEFVALTHDSKEIKGKPALRMKIEEGLEPGFNVAYTKTNTVILNNGTLYVLGNNLKMKVTAPLYSYLDTLDIKYYEEDKLLKADDEKVWVLLNDYLLIYNYQKKVLLKRIDLTTWEPMQALIDENRIWLVSRKDGLLYGLLVE